MKLLPAFFVLDTKGNIFTPPQDVSSADESLAFSSTVGDHMDCGGYIKWGLIKNVTNGLNTTDYELTCSGCGLTVAVPRKVTTYGALYNYLRHLVGWDDDDD